MNPQSPKPLFPDPDLPGKRRTARIARDYLSRTNVWDSKKKKWAWGLTIVAAVMALYTLATRTGAQAFSRGPVISAHAAHEHSCEQCHQNFEPISGEAAGLRFAEWSHTQDSKCQKCHLMPQHNARSLYDPELQTAEANCASCHQDHQGRDFNLLRVADRHCTNCHADLEHHRKKIDENISATIMGKPIADKITAFNDASHPDFRSIVDPSTGKQKADPSRLKFNHALHMSAGLPQKLSTPNSHPTPRDPFTNSDLAKYGAPLGKADSYQKLYAAIGKGEIQMNCADCHEQNRADPKFANAGLAVGENSSTAGDYYLPVIYERHCVACHTLPYQAGGSLQPEHYVPHRSTSQQLQDFVQRKIYYSKLEGIEDLDQQLKKRPPVMPGNRVSGIVTPDFQKQIDDAIKESARSLKDHTCSKCHAEITTSPSNPFPQVPPPIVPRRWYEHAKFNHHSHRDVDCRTCHQQAYPDDPDASLTSASLMIPLKQNCQQCHTPEISTNSLGKTIGGAGHHCTECHDYHNHQSTGLPRTATDLSIVNELFSAVSDHSAADKSKQHKSSNK